MTEHCRNHSWVTSFECGFRCEKCGQPRGRFVTPLIAPDPPPSQKEAMTNPAAQQLLDDALTELVRSRTLFPSPDHLVLALAEEAGEAVKAACDVRQGKADLKDLRKEIVQTIAMCLRLATEGDPTQGIPMLVCAGQVPTKPSDTSYGGTKISSPNLTLALEEGWNLALCFTWSDQAPDWQSDALAWRTSYVKADGTLRTLNEVDSLVATAAMWRLLLNVHGGNWGKVLNPAWFDAAQKWRDTHIEKVPPPKLRPWVQAEVRVGDVIRYKLRADCWTLISGCDQRNVFFYIAKSLSFSEAFAQCEWKRQHETTWRPCGVEA